jgi:hypothetical protein
VWENEWIWGNIYYMVKRSQKIYSL